MRSVGRAFRQTIVAWEYREWRVRLLYSTAGVGATLVRAGRRGHAASMPKTPWRNATPMSLETGLSAMLHAGFKGCDLLERHLFIRRAVRACRKHLTLVWAVRADCAWRTAYADLPRLLWRLRPRVDEAGLAPGRSVTGWIDDASRTFQLIAAVAGPMAVADLGCYPVGFARYLMATFSDGMRTDGDGAARWQAAIAAARPWLRRLAVSVPVDPTLRVFLDTNVRIRPRTRLGWLALLAWWRWRSQRDPVGDNEVGTKSTLESGAEAASGFDTHAWDAWIRTRGAHPVTIASLIECFSFIEEGRRISGLTVPGIRYQRVPSRGSVAKAVRAAAWNLRSYRSAICRGIGHLARPGYPGFPPALEALRLKTVGAMLDAGVACGNCLGIRYLFDPDLFLRRGDLVARINHWTLEHEETQDRRNTESSASQAFATEVEEALEAWRGSVESEPEVDDEQPWTDLGMSKPLYDHYGEVIEFYGTVQAALWDSHDIGMLEHAIVALGALGDALCDLDRPDEALEVYAMLVKRFDALHDARIVELVARALFCMAKTLAMLGRLDEAITAYDEALARCGNRVEDGLVAEAAEALVGKGDALAGAGRVEEARIVYQDVMLRYGDARAANVLEQVAKAMLRLGNLHGRASRFHAELAAYEAVVLRFSRRDEDGLGDVVADALLAIGNRLAELDRGGVWCRRVVEERYSIARQLMRRDRYAESLALLDGVVGALERVDATPDAASLLADVLFSKGLALGGLRRLDEMAEACRQVVLRFDDRSEPRLQERVADAFFMQGLALGEAGRQDAATRVFCDIERKYAGRTERHFVLCVAQSMYHKGRIVHEAGYADQALVALEELSTRLYWCGDVEVQGYIAMAMAYRTRILQDVGRHAEADAVGVEFEIRFKDPVDPALRYEVERSRKWMRAKSGKSEYLH